MQYDRAIASLFALSSRGIRLGVGRMGEALEYRGHPQRGMTYVQIAGTNGKGSTATMVATVLARAGYRTGLFTSPHLHRWVERIRVDGRPLTQREAAKRIAEVLEDFARPGAPETTFFELTTLMALETFRDHQCDVAVLEVGLGGRLDATTAIQPTVTAITRVARDHTGVLGDTLAEIAAEKAGIFKPGVPAVIGVREPAARDAIVARAAVVGAPLRLIDRDFRAQQATRGRFKVTVSDRVFDDLRLRLSGPHQQHNAACAVAVLCELANETPLQALDWIGDGLSKVKWPGRLETIARKPEVLVDAAHNVDGCQALVRALRTRSISGPRILVFGCMVDKEVAAMLSALAPAFDKVIYPPAAMPRAASPASLVEIHPGELAASVPDALARAHGHAGDTGLVVIAGSVFVVAAFRAQVLGVREDPAIRM